MNMHDGEGKNCYEDVKATPYPPAPTAPSCVCIFWGVLPRSGDSTLLYMRLDRPSCHTQYSTWIDFLGRLHLSSPLC